MKLLLSGLIVLSLLPFSWIIFTSPPSLWITVGAGVAGLMATTVFFWQLLLGNRFITSRFTDDVIAVNKFHQWLGINGTILALLHPVLIFFSYGRSLSFILIPRFATQFDLNVLYGRTALLLFLTIWITSALLRQRIKYRPWLYLHYLAYPMIALILFHAKDIGTHLNTYPVLMGYWQGLILVFSALILHRLSQWAGVGKAQYKLVEKKALSDEVFQYRFRPINRPLHPKIGQYCYIQKTRFREAHPFTVMEFDENTGELIFGIKDSGPYSKSLTKLDKNQVVYLDGPYGIFTREGQNPQPKVLIAGGIGITPFVELVERNSNEYTYLFYSNKRLKDAVKRDQLKKQLNARYIDAVTQEKPTDRSIITGRLTADTIKKTIPKSTWSQAQFFLCGPKPFYESIATGLADLGVADQRIHYEAFEL